MIINYFKNKTLQNTAVIKDLPSQKNSSTQTIKTQTLSCPINSDLYAAYNNINFTGKAIDNTTFRQDLINHSETYKENIKINNADISADFYKTNHSEYVFLKDNNKIYKLHYTQDSKRIKEQVIASKLYNSVDIRTPEYIPFEKDGKTGFLTEIIEEELKPVDENPQALYDSFIADVWLGNRNGLSNGNTKLDKNGNIVKLSVSGSLDYRAGGKRKDKPFNYNIDEITSMRNSAINPQSAYALKDMTQEELNTAVKNFLNKYSLGKAEEIIKEYKDEDYGELFYIIKGRKRELADLNKNIYEQEILTKRGYADKKDKNGEKLSSIDLDYLLKITDDEWENLKERKLLEPSLNIKKLSMLDLHCLAKLTNDEHQKALERNLYAPHFDSKGYDDISGYDIETFCKLSEEQWEVIEKRGLLNLKKNYGYVGLYLCDIVVNTLLNLDEKTWQELKNSALMNIYFSNDDITKFLEKLNDDTSKSLYPSYSQRIRTLVCAIDRIGKYKTNLNTQQILNIAAVDNNGWERIKNYTNNFSNMPYESHILFLLGNIDDKTFEVLEKRNLLNSLKDFKSQKQLMYLSELSDDEWQRVEQRNLKEKFPADPESWMYLSQLTTDEYQKAQDKYLFDERCGKYFINELRFFSAKDISSLIYNMDENDWRNLEKRQLITQKYVTSTETLAPASCSVVIGLAKMSDDEYERFIKLNAESYGHRTDPEELFGLVQLDEVQYERIFNRGLFQFADKYENIYSVAFDVKMLSELDDNEYQQLLGRDDECKTIAAKVLVIKANNLKLDKKQSLNELSLSEKRQYLNLLVSKNEMFLSKDFIDNYPKSKIIPQDAKEFVQIINELVKSLGIDTRAIDEKQKEEFFNALDEISSGDSEFLKTDFSDHGFKINIKYKREDFINDIFDLTLNLDEKERMKVWDYFGFELNKNEDNEIIMSGFPSLINNGKKLEEINNPLTGQKIEQIKPCIKRYTIENSVIPDGKYINDDTAITLNTILKSLPELYSLIGKKQHKTHDYTLDVHTFAVLSQCIKNPEFQKLNQKQKRLLMLAALCHDIEKGQKNTNSSHAKNSAYSAYYIMEKFNLNEDEKTDIYQLIKCHEFLGECYKKISDKNTNSHIDTDKVISKYAWELRKNNLVQMEKILTKADLLSVKRNGSFFSKNEHKFNNAFEKLNEKVYEISKTAIPLPKTRIPKASDIKTDNKNCYEVITKDEQGNEIKNKVLYLSENLDLEQFGFDKGTNAQNFNVIVHGFDDEMQQAILIALGLIDRDVLLSTSYVIGEKGNYRVFRPQGFIMDTADDDIGAAYYRDFGSGFQKTVESLINSYINGPNKIYRQYFSDFIKNELNINDDEFIELYKQIKNKPLNVLEQEKPEIAKVFSEIFRKTEVHKRKFGRDYNEILITKGTPCAVFFEGETVKGKHYEYDDIPLHLKKYAKDNNIPIIHLGG